MSYYTRYLTQDGYYNYAAGDRIYLGYYQLKDIDITSSGSTLYLKHRSYSTKLTISGWNENASIILGLASNDYVMQNIKEGNSIGNIVNDTVLLGNNSEQKLVLLGSGNNIYTFGGNDVIRAFASNNVIDTGAGDDIISLYNLDIGHITAGSGSDTIKVLSKIASDKELIIDQTGFTSGDKDIVILSKISKKDISGYYYSGEDISFLLTNGGKINITNWKNNPCQKIIFNDGIVKSDLVGLNLLKVELSGNFSNMLIQGGVGDDIINISGDGNTINTVDGNDSITITQDLATVVTIDSGNDNDTIVINGKNSSYASKISTGTVNTGSGKDTVTINNGGYYRIDTGAGGDTVYVNAGSNIINTGSGEDYIKIDAWGKANYVDAGDDKDIIEFEGNSKYSYIKGGAGDDTITIKNSGSSYYNLVEGGTGDDTYVIDASYYKVVIDNTTANWSDFDCVKINTTYSNFAYYYSYYDAARDIYNVRDIVVLGCSKIDKIYLDDCTFTPSQLISMAQSWDMSQVVTELAEYKAGLQTYLNQGISNNEIAISLGYSSK